MHKHEYGLVKRSVCEHQLAGTTVTYEFLKMSFSFTSQQKASQPVPIFERDDKKEGSRFLRERLCRNISYIEELITEKETNKKRKMKNRKLNNVTNKGMKGKTQESEGTEEVNKIIS
jgi:hypothetical protein